MKFEGVSAIVTGGASGLGGATVRRLVAAGAKVVIVDLDETKGPALAEELGDGAVFVKADVSSAEDVKAAIDRASELGTFRVAVSCAGVGWAARTLNRKGEPHELELYQKIIGINLIGTFNVLRLSASAISQSEALEHGERGCIVNTASIAAYDGQVGQIAYASSKAGVVGMTLPAARDLAPVGVRVCTIAPGLFDTPMLASLPEEVRASLAATVVFPKRLGDPAEYAELVHTIVSSGYLNAEVIRLDGALRMAPK